MAPTLNQQPYPVRYIKACIVGLLLHMVLYLLSAHCKKISHLYSWPMSAKEIFLQASVNVSVMDFIVAWHRCCLHPVSLPQDQQGVAVSFPLVLSEVPCGNTTHG